jgi:integrase/recombinase XerD
MMIAALDLPPKGTINPYTYHYLLGLLSATGLRISEALALQRKDLTDDGLIIRHAKFDKKRLVPVHATTRQALKNYATIRDRLDGADDGLFVISSGHTPNKRTVGRIFVLLARRLGIRGAPGTPGPRLHDLRHTFATRSLEAVAHDRQAIGHHMAALSTYLGHSSLEHTYWYLEATPVLLHKIAEVNEGLFEGDVL